MRPRTPDLERASAMTGAPLRSVPTGPATVTPMTPQVRIHNARPTSFDEVSVLADKFKSGTPVILDLTRAPAAQQRRFIDFASGLTYALDGGISKVADLIFMLTPHNVEMRDLEQRKFGSARTIF
jgi:cell division inhibitor SepF